MTSTCAYTYLFFFFFYFFFCFCFFLAFQGKASQLFEPKLLRWSIGAWFDAALGSAADTFFSLSYVSPRYRTRPITADSFFVLFHMCVRLAFCVSVIFGEEFATSMAGTI